MNKPWTTVLFIYFCAVFVVVQEECEQHFRAVFICPSAVLVRDKNLFLCYVSYGQFAPVFVK